MVYLDNGILFGKKKEWNTRTFYNMDELENNYAEWKKLVLKDFIFYDSV